MPVSARLRALPASALALACAVATTLAPPAFAAPEQDHSAAVESFRRGTQLVEQGKLQEAIEAFRTALVQEPSSVGARLNLADCYEKVGAPAQAWRQYALAAMYAGAAGDARLTMAHDSATHLESQLVKVTIAPPTGQRLEVRVDDEAIEPELVQAGPLALAPGRHRIEATALGKKPSIQQVEGVAGEARVVTIAFEDEPVTKPASIGAGEWPAQKKWAIVVGGVGAAGGIAGAVLGLVAMAKKSTVVGEQTDPSIGASRFASDLDDARTLATASTVSFIAGGVVLAAGATLWLTAPAPAPAGAAGIRLRVGPQVGPANGVVAVGSF